MPLIVVLLLVVGMSFDVRALSEVRDSSRPVNYLDLWLRPEVFTERGNRLRRAGMRVYLCAAAGFLLSVVLL
jgi:hypothetical protein